MAHAQAHRGTAFNRSSCRCNEAARIRLGMMQKRKTRHAAGFSCVRDGLRRHLT